MISRPDGSSIAHEGGRLLSLSLCLSLLPSLSPSVSSDQWAAEALDQGCRSIGKTASEPSERPLEPSGTSFSARLARSSESGLPGLLARLEHFVRLRSLSSLAPLFGPLATERPKSSGKPCRSARAERSRKPWPLARAERAASLLWTGLRGPPPRPLSVLWPREPFYAPGRQGPFLGLFSVKPEHGIARTQEGLPPSPEASLPSRG